jgi:exodeoxyribonuclease-3
MRKGAWDWVEEVQPDIVCLQEIRARPEQLPRDQRDRIEGLKTCWHPAERPGYSGVLTVANRREMVLQKGLGVPRFDREGRAIRGMAGDVVLFNVYVPNGKRDHSRVPYKLDFYASLLRQCDRLHAEGKGVVICGDINTAHQEIDLRNPRENRNTTGFLPEERAWIDRFLSHGLVDAFRSRYPDREAYTWWTYRLGARDRDIGWRLDYFLVSEALMDRVEEVAIHTEVLGSDHCPISLRVGPPP